MTRIRLAIVSTLVLVVAAMPAAAQHGGQTKMPAKLRAQATITDSAARAIALKVVKGGTIHEGELEREDGRLVYSYEITVPGQAGDHEVQVDAKTGAVVSHERDDTDSDADDRAAKKAKPAAGKP